MNDLERRLAALAPEYPFPATPDLAGAAGARLGISGRRRRTGRLVLVLAAVVAACAAVLAASPGARSALADWLDFLPGVRVERVDELPSMPLAAWTGVYGERVTLAEAEREAPFPVLLPESQGEPDIVYRYRDASGGLVITAVYGDERDARLVLTQWTTQDVLFHKLLGPATQAELVDVREARGLWINGNEHVVFYLGGDFQERAAPGALAGNVLLWQEGRVGYRLEAGVGLERALELAADLRG
jgi:hypothetical protein